MRTLYLHLGYFKTGSSFLQEMWRLNEAILREQKIIYQIPVRIKGGGFGKITSGNGGLALRSASELRGALINLNQESSCLLSSEHFFTQVVDGEDMAFVPEVASALGFDKVEFLLFVRDPFEMMSSLYDQSLKRAGGAMTIEDFYNDPNLVVTPAKTLSVISKLDAVENVSLTVRNYSRNKKQILEISSEWLGVDYSRFSKPSIQTVNRSLSSGEREFLRQLNGLKARSAIDLANSLCKDLPLIQSDQIAPSSELQQKFLSANEDVFTKIQARLPDDEPLSLEFLPTPVTEDFSFTREQLSMIVDYLVRYQKKEGFLASKVISFRKRFGI